MKKKKIIIPAVITSILILIAVWFFWPEETVTYAFVYRNDPGIEKDISGYTPEYPDARFMVISDLHLFDPVLGTSGQAFMEYLDGDRKLIKESSELLVTAKSMILHQAPDFVLIPGDLTKDGEKQSHLLLAHHLEEIESLGIKVFVVPGNHDINNGLAYSYPGDHYEKIPTIQADEFAEIYRDFGYTEALQRDPDSLSYAAEPVPGLLLLAMDACRYRENKPDEESIVDGRFSQQTVSWIETILRTAKKDNKPVIAMMHHGVVAHFASQEKHFGEYLVDAAPQIAGMLAYYKVRILFTGHFHAQDIAMYKGEDTDFLYDVETGSLVSYPSPIRSIAIRNNTMNIDSQYIGSIASKPRDFPAFSKQFLHDGIKNLSIQTMKKYWVSQEDAVKLAPKVADAFLVHYTGADVPPGVTLNPKDLLDDDNLSLIGGIVIGQRKDLVWDLWHDVPPGDNTLVIDLKTGKIK
ncbi:MAG: metallophosphoesterase [Spirochaetales bacterium]|nr:metallophosphoesterase [Spirochaetales bacterium]